MDAEERERLEHIESLAEENNEMLHKLHRAEQRRFWFRMAYWFLIIAFSLGSYYLIQPYLEALGDATGANFGSFIKLPGFGDK